MKLLLLLIALLVGEICLAEETSLPPKEKDGTGAGRYNSGYHHSDHHYGKHHRYRTPIVDDYICDLEATILVVSSKHHIKEEKSYGKTQDYGKTPAYGGSQDYGKTPAYGGSQQGYGAAPQQGYGNNGPSYGGSSYEKPKRHEYSTPDALRLKCSHIAVHSEHDCHTCCRLSARRYHSYSKHEIFGFIIDASEIKENGKGGKSYERSKRDADYGSQPAPTSQNYQSQGYGQSVPAPSYSTAAPNYQAPEASYPVPDYPVPSYSAPTPEYQEQPQAYSADSEYPSTAPASYSGKSHHSYGPPKDARCVCCSPKRHDYHHKHHNYDDDRSYDRSDSDEY